MNIFSVRLEVTNPWAKDTFCLLGNRYWRISTNKNLELEHWWYPCQLLLVDISWSLQTDHAGLDITLALCGYGIHQVIYDSRHWDSDANSWH